MAKLVLFLADGSTLDVALDRERISIGRRTGNDVCLPYPAVSGKHAMVVTMPSGSVLDDLGSTNGTLVNGKRISKYFLHDRDTIDIGRQKLVYCVDNAAVVEASSQWRSSRFDEHGARGSVAAMSRSSAARGPASQSAGDASVHTNITVRLSADSLSEAAIAAFAANQASGIDLDAELGIDDGDASVPASGPLVRVLTGPSAGQVLSLNKDEVLVGRIGVQVAAVRNTADGFRLVLVEGTLPPQVNGVAVPDEGALLASGDVAEVAGVRLEFVGPETSPGPAPAKQ